MKGKDKLDTNSAMKSSSLADRASQERERYEAGYGIAQPPRRMVRPDLWEDAWQRGYREGVMEAGRSVAKIECPEEPTITNAVRKCCATINVAVQKIMALLNGGY